MRLLLPMAYTIVLVMKSVTHSHGKTLPVPKDNYSYRLLEVDIEPEKGALYVRQPYNIRPLSNDYNDEDDERKNLYQGNIIPRRTRTNYAVNEDNKGIGKNDNNDNHIGRDKIVVTKAKKFNGKNSMQNGNVEFNVEIPEDFQKEISQLRIPRRVTKKKKSKLSPKKLQQQEAPLDMDGDADMDMDMNMDMNLDMDMDVNVNAEPGEQDPYGGSGDSNDTGGGHGGNEHEHQQEHEHEDEQDQENQKKKSRKRYKNRKRKRKKNKNITSDNTGGPEDTENDESGSEIGNNIDNDENNHQEEEEEVEEKKEKVHKVTIKKKRPYLNETKVMSETTVPAKHQGGSGVGSSTTIPYQSVQVSPKPRKNKVKGGMGSGAIMTPTAISWQNQLQNNVAQPGKLVKLLKPLISQETVAANTINPNHLAESSTVRKGIKPRDVNLILRTKHSPRILIRRYKPLLGVYPVGVGAGLNLQQQHKRLGLYHRPHKTRRKVCRKCKKKIRQYPLYANAYPTYASDVETFHPSNEMVTGTTQCPHTGSNHNQHYSSSTNVATESPMQMINSAIGTGGSTYPWYGTSSPDHYNPNNKFEYVDENLISPRLPSQPVNTYVPMPVKSGRSSDDNDNDSSNHNHRNKNQNQNQDQDQNQNEYQTSSPLLGEIDSTGDSGTNHQSLDESDDSLQKQERDKDENNTTPTDTYLVQETDIDNDSDNDNDNDNDKDKDNDPYAGHKKVELLAAVHQRETDAGLFDDDHDHSPLQHRHSHLLQDAVESTAPAAKIVDKFQNEKDIGLDVEAEMAEEDDDEEDSAAMATHKQDPPKGQVEGNDEDDQQEQEYIDEENQSGGEKSQSDKLFESWAPDDTA